MHHGASSFPTFSFMSRRKMTHSDGCTNFLNQALRKKKNEIKKEIPEKEPTGHQLVQVTTSKPSLSLIAREDKTKAPGGADCH